MASLAARLGALEIIWRARGFTPGSGAAPTDIARVESELGIALPAEVREYFTTVNGMAEDPGLQTVDPLDVVGATVFWPLARVVPVKATDVEAPHCFRGCYLFADYLIDSHAYAFRLSHTGGGVVMVGGAEPLEVASSFSEFLRLYLESPRDLL